MFKTPRECVRVEIYLDLDKEKVAIILCFIKKYAARYLRQTAIPSLVVGPKYAV